jgi:hypothetical protein
VRPWPLTWARSQTASEGSRAELDDRPSPKSGIKDVMNTTNQSTISIDAPNRAIVLLVAGRAEADVRTVTKFLRGERVRPLAAARCVRACRELGIEIPRLIFR